MQTCRRSVASRFTSRTRAGSPSALNSSAVASASSSESVDAASGAQQTTGFEGRAHAARPPCRNAFKTACSRTLVARQS